MGSLYYQSKADDLFWGYFTLIVKFARLTTLENRVTYKVATAEWPQKVSYRDENRASLKTRKAWQKHLKPTLAANKQLKINVITATQRLCFDCDFFFK